MSEVGAGPPRDTFVPASFEDLRRNTASQGEALERRREEQIRTRQDFGDLVGDHSFMRRSKWIGAVGLGLGGVLILVAYAKPLFQTTSAVQTAAVVASHGGQSQFGAIGRLAGQAAAIKDTDIKAINMAKGGLSCLTGKTGCAGGASSPFK